MGAAGARSRDERIHFQGVRQAKQACSDWWCLTEISHPESNEITAVRQSSHTTIGNPPLHIAWRYCVTYHR